MGGSLLTAANRTHIFDHTSKDETVYESQRRSVYLPVVRNHLHDVFMLFDYTDASVPVGNRNTSTVPSQSLYLMNSEFLKEASAGLARRLQHLSSDEETRIETLYKIALGRNANRSEIERAKEYLAGFGRELSSVPTSQHGVELSAEAWRLLCQVVLMSNEFSYLR